MGNQSKNEQDCKEDSNKLHRAGRHGSGNQPKNEEHLQADTEWNNSWFNKEKGHIIHRIIDIPITSTEQKNELFKALKYKQKADRKSGRLCLWERLWHSLTNAAQTLLYVS